MNFNLVEMYNGLLRFNKHILNELAEGLKHLPNLDGVSKGDTNYNSVYLLKKGINHADITIDNIQDKCYFIGDQANANSFITEFDFRFGPYFVPNKVGTNKKADYNWIRGNNGQDTDKTVRVFCLAVALITVLRLALVTLILLGFGRILLLMSASLSQLNLIK